MLSPELIYQNEYQTLLRSLIFKDGFGLFFVECSPSQAKRLIADIKQELSERTVGELHLFKEAENFYDKVAEFTEGKKFDILFVREFEKLIFDYIGPGFGGVEKYYNLDTAPKVLAHINLQRERIKESFPISFVFLLSRFALNYFIRRSPDFFDWRNGLIILTSQEENLQQASKIISQIGEYPKYLCLTSHQRKEIIDSYSSTIDSADMKRLTELGTLCLIEGKYEISLKCFDKILIFDTNNDMAWCYRGYVLFRLERYEKSISSYERAVEIKPEFYEFSELLGIAFDAFGHYDKAKKSFSRAGKEVQNIQKAIPSETEIDEWLYQVGFKWNPFKKDKAENEKNLKDYFIEPVGFEELLKHEHSVLYASSGGGKTACFKMIEQFTCGNYLPGRRIFCVTYDNFGRVLERAGSLESVTILSHVEVILDNSIQRLTRYLFKNPRKKEQLDKNILTNFIKMIHLLKGDVYIDELQACCGITLEMPATENNPQQTEPKDMMNEFYNLIKGVCFEGVFILVDKVDGTPETKNNFHACAALLKPFADAIPSMSNKDIFFKFFLPLEMKPLMEQFNPFVLKYVNPITIEWQSNELADILLQRLSAATQENKTPITSLDAFLAGNKSIDSEVIKGSQTPRDIILKSRIISELKFREKDEYNVR